MQNVKVLSGQSLFDIAIQYTGDVHHAYLIALANVKSITDVLTVDELITIPDELTKASRELNYLTNLEILPSTGLTQAQESDLIETLGIGTMIIKSTFIVG